jgi:hypothetical protein
MLFIVRLEDLSERSRKLLTFCCLLLCLSGSL